MGELILLGFVDYAGRNEHLDARGVEVFVIDCLQNGVFLLAVGDTIKNVWLCFGVDRVLEHG